MSQNICIGDNFFWYFSLHICNCDIYSVFCSPHVCIYDSVSVFRFPMFLFVTVFCISFLHCLYLWQLFCIGKRWKILPRDPEQGTLARNILIHKLKTFSYLQIILICKLKKVSCSQIILIHKLKTFCYLQIILICKLKKVSCSQIFLIHKLKTFSYLQIILIHKLKTVPYSQIIRITIRKKQTNHLNLQTQDILLFTNNLNPQTEDILLIQKSFLPTNHSLVIAPMVILSYIFLPWLYEET